MRSAPCYLEKSFSSYSLRAQFLAKRVCGCGDPSANIQGCNSYDPQSTTFLYFDIPKGPPHGHLPSEIMTLCNTFDFIKIICPISEETGIFHHYILVKYMLRA